MTDVTQQPLLTLDQAAKQLGLGRTKIYDLINNEGLPIIKFGKSTRINPASLQEWLKAREQRASQQ